MWNSKSMIAFDEDVLQLGIPFKTYIASHMVIMYK